MTLGELKYLIVNDEGETVVVKESTELYRDACEVQSKGEDV